MKLADIKKGIKRAREERGLSQKELADELKIGVSTVQNWEQINRNPPKVETLLELCDFFNCDMAYLTGELTDFKTYDNKHISKKTGLKEDAIEKLITLHNDGINDLADFGGIISEILLHPDFPKIINYIMRMKNSDNPSMESHEKQKTYASLASINDTERAVELSKDDRFNLFKWECSHLFTKLIEDVGHNKKEPG